MEENLARLIDVVTADLAHPIVSRAIRAEYDVPFLDPFRDCPQSSAGQPSSDFRLVGVLRQVDGNELLIECSPFVRQFLRQVLVDAEVGADEVPGEAFRRINALLSQHNSVVAFDGLHTNRTFPVRSSCIMPCLNWRTLASFASRIATCASMSLR